MAGNKFTLHSSFSSMKRFLLIVCLYCVAYSASAQAAPFADIAPSVTLDSVQIRLLAQPSGNPSEVRVFDVFGILLFRRILPTDFGTFALNLAPFAAGVYVVEVRQGSHAFKRKVIKRNP